MLRLFVGIDFPPELKLRLSLLCSGVPGAKWVDPGNFHLTLRFIGEITEDIAVDVDEALARLRGRRFDLQLAGVGIFGGNKPHALWAGIERDAELLRLRDRIEQALVRAGLPPEQRKFAPHVTLARLRNPDLDKLGHFLAMHAQFRAAPLPVEHFSLIASFPTKAGSVYEDQADYPLSG
ncbi:MAG TPA: RNA 2',3'-cyclic phosphodiesterase [Stellaceae bacterium]|jgi:2'-5' RNA ligase|nr:RNA 2',3'-cyclic phosphodiesterase [Stellaceae bacterium]